MRRDPLVKQGEAELAFRQRFHHELESRLAADVEVESIHEQKRVSSGKPNAFVAVHEGMIINQRLQQRGRLFAQVVVVAGLRTEDRGFQSALIEHSGFAAVLLDLVMMDGGDFGYGEVDALGHYLASFLYSSRYFSLERR